MYIYSSPHYTHSIPNDEYKIVEMLKIKMISIFGVTMVLCLIKSLINYRNLSYPTSKLLGIAQLTPSLL